MALLGRRRSALEEIADVARTADQCLVIPADVTDKRAVKTSFGLVLERFGRLDVLFKNGGGKVQPVPINDPTLEQWQSDIDVNLTGNSCGLSGAMAWQKTLQPVISCGESPFCTRNTPPWGHERRC